ncbi:MAG: DNA-binding protein [bacterium]|nr:DNA-binding protein [bacterium]
MKKNGYILVVIAFLLMQFVSAYPARADKKMEMVKKNKKLLEPGGHKGKVVETMDSGGYTYVLFREGEAKLWVASRVFNVAVGDTIEFLGAAPMKDFRSNTLKRTFKTVLLVNKILVNGEDPWSLKGVKLPKGHIPLDKQKKKRYPISVKPGSIKKVKGGFTVAQCFSGKESLSGQTVKVRGIVVKFTGSIMGKNWIHIQDGTGEPGTTDDLTVTTGTKSVVAVGDRVNVTGKIIYDKVLGPNYKFAALVEEATVVLEKGVEKIK